VLLTFGTVAVVPIEVDHMYVQMCGRSSIAQFSYYS
jgi:hypothetical protein